MATTGSNLKFNRVYWQSELRKLDCHAVKEVLDLMEKLYKETIKEVKEKENE